MGWKLQLAVVVMLVLLGATQLRLWFGEGSLLEMSALSRQLATQRAELEELRERNATLRAEVEDLKTGLAAIEARARSELGLVREGETYFQLIPPDKGDADE